MDEIFRSFSFRVRPPGSADQDNPCVTTSREPATQDDSTFGLFVLVILSFSRVVSPFFILIFALSFFTNVYETDHARLMDQVTRHLNIYIRMYLSLIYRDIWNAPKTFRNSHLRIHSLCQFPSFRGFAYVYIFLPFYYFFDYQSARNFDT